MKNLLFLIGFIFILGCGDDEDSGLPIEEQISNYITENNLTTQETSSGLHVAIEEAGGAAKPNGFNTITIDYVGTYLDGEEFDSNTNFVAKLNSLINGWQEGIPFFGAGGNGTLIIPPNLGYGSNPSNGIRPNAVLVFDIKLVDFN